MKTIAVIFGGRSAEHDVSIVTALAAIIKPLELSGKYHVEAVYIGKNGDWFWDNKLKDIKLYQTGAIEDFCRNAPKVHLLFDTGLTLVKSSQFAGRKKYQKVDVVFPAMHGTFGEDGDLMGLLEMAGVAYVGCGVAASAVAMDKVLCKLVTGAAGIYSPPWLWFSAGDLADHPDKLVADCREFTYPLFVKPARLGSSIGISKVDTEKELINAFEVAAHYDDKVIVEQAVQNLVEVTLPIMGNEQPRPAMLEEPVLNTSGVFDFDTKYMQQGKGKMGGKSGGGKQGAQGYSKIPAEVSSDIHDKAVAMGLAVYRTLGCEGVARVDMLIDNKAGKVFFNEVNPLPGSLYAHNWRAAGVSSVELVTKLIDLAEDRFVKKQKLNTSFNTNFLKQF